MLPRRSFRLRLRQLNDQKAATSLSSSSSSSLSSLLTSSKSIEETAKKRARSETFLQIEDAEQPKQKKRKLATTSLESFPVEILEKIFIRIDDMGLLNLAKTSVRFEAIAQTVFAKRYANQYFIGKRKKN